jgi:apolipoprotein N-acyltransferase
MTASPRYNSELSRSAPSLVALLAGASYPLAFAPFHLYPALLLSIAALFGLLCSRPHQGAWLGWLFGVGKYAVGVSWVYVSIHDHGGASPALAGGLVAGFVAFMALFCWPIGWFVGAVEQRQHKPSKLILGIAFVAAWVLMEWLLTWFLTGFPWLFAGHAVTGMPLQSLLPVMGTLGVSLVIVGAAVGLVLAIDPQPGSRQRPVALLGLVAIAALSLWLNGLSWTTPQGTYSAALVQGNLNQAEKWDNDKRLTHVRTHLDLSAQHWDVDVLVWPEFALTVYGEEADAVTQRLHQQGRDQNTNVIIGMPDLQWQDDGGYQIFNSAQGFGAAAGKFAKHHLVPFGDYVPMQAYLRGIIEFFDLPMSAATPGQREQGHIALQLLGQSDPVLVATGICYEIAYGESLRRQAVDSGLLLTLSNDTWFGRSIGPHQHMQIAQVRALENGRWLLRATNSGVTGMVNPRGELVAALPQFEARVLRGEFQVMSGRTPYSYLGDWPVFMVTLMALVALVLRLGPGQRAKSPH